MLKKSFLLIILAGLMLAPLQAQLSIPGLEPSSSKEKASNTHPPSKVQLFSDSIAAIKTDSPRDTMRTFMRAMNDYKKGVENNDPVLRARIHDAVATLNLSEVPLMIQTTTGEEAAIFLKEAIDRVVVINEKKIPTQQVDGRWRLAKTNIVINRVDSGNERGEWLFSPQTVAHAENFFNQVKERPYLKGSGRGAAYQPSWIEESLPPWAFESVFEIALWQWMGLLLALFFGFTVRMVVKGLAEIILPLTHKTRTELDTILVERCSGPLALIVSSLIWLVSLYLLKFKGNILVALTILVQLVATIALIWFFYRLVEVMDLFLKEFISKRKSNSGMDKQLAKLLVQTLKVFVVVFGVLLGVQNLGVNVFSLLAGLGIMGAAVAFAAKDTLANLFGSILIMVDRPFRVGDWVIIAGNEGTVEDIGFRSTRIRTFYNSLITIPNGEAAVKPIDNMGLRTYRRYRTIIRLTYDTPAEKVEAFCEGIKNIIKASPSTRKDYFHVVLNDFDASSLNVLLYMFFKVPDWSYELVERHHTILEIIRLAQRLEIEFAFPTQTLHVESMVTPGVMKKHPEWSPEELKVRAQEFGPQGSYARPGGSGFFTPPYEDPDLIEKKD